MSRTRHGRDPGLAVHCADMRKSIVGYHQDEEAHWVAELACGHNQHVRHQPPWTSRPWVATEAGRNSRLGSALECRKCDAGAPPDNRSGR
jgi:hypothetical protein